MSAFSTMYITRKDAIDEIIKALDKASDDEIASILFNTTGINILYDFKIIEEYDEHTPDYRYDRFGF